MKHKILIVCTTDSMIWNFLIPHIHDFEQNGYTVECASSVTGLYFENLKKLGIVMHEIPFCRSPYKAQNIQAYRQLKQLITDNQYDIIFCHEPVGGAMGRLAGHACGCKVIYMAHGFHFYKGAPAKASIYYAVEKYLSRLTDCLITINQEDYEASLKFHAKRYVLMSGIGVDTSKFKYHPQPSYLRNELKLSDQTMILLSVGELIARKNHESVIRALPQLQNADIHYVIAGDGELDQYLKELVNQVGVSNRVHFLGYRTDINQLCNASDIFVMPSFQEGLSVALMEAMSCGLPVIASRIRGNVDLIVEGKGGILVSPDQLGEYADAIKDLTANAAKRGSFGAFNRQAVKSYDIQCVRQQLQKVFREIAGESE